jgi:hypothetical protein
LYCDDRLYVAALDTPNRPTPSHRVQINSGLFRLSAGGGRCPDFIRVLCYRRLYVTAHDAFVGSCALYLP